MSISVESCFVSSLYQTYSEVFVQPETSATYSLKPFLLSFNVAKKCYLALQEDGKVTSQRMLNTFHSVIPWHLVLHHVTLGQSWKYQACAVRRDSTVHWWFVSESSCLYWMQLFVVLSKEVLHWVAEQLKVVFILLIKFVLGLFWKRIKVFFGKEFGRAFVTRCLIFWKLHFVTNL